MSKYPPGENLVSITEFARFMGKSKVWALNELRLDSEREHRRYPFAVASRNPETHTWSYRIYRERFESWCAGQPLDLDYDLLAETIVQKLMEQAGGKHASGILAGNGGAR